MAHEIFRVQLLQLSLEKEGIIVEQEALEYLSSRVLSLPSFLLTASSLIEKIVFYLEQQESSSLSLEDAIDIIERRPYEH